MNQKLENASVKRLQHIKLVQFNRFVFKILSYACILGDWLVIPRGCDGFELIGLKRLIEACSATAVYASALAVFDTRPSASPHHMLQG